MGKTQVASIFKKGKEAIRKGEEHNGTCKKSKEFKSMGKTEMENQIWKKILETGERYLPEKAIKSLSAAEYAATTKAKRQGTKKGKTICETTERYCKKTAKYRRYK